MQIDLPPAELERLTQLAAESGYDSPERFVTERLIEMANETSDSEALAANLEACDRGMAQVEAGGGHDAREALLKLGRDRGFRRDR